MKKTILVLILAAFCFTANAQKFTRTLYTTDWSTLAGSDTSFVVITSTSGQVGVHIDSTTYGSTDGTFNVSVAPIDTVGYADWSDSRLPKLLTGDAEFWYFEFLGENFMKITLTPPTTPTGITRLYVTIKED